MLDVAPLWLTSSDNRLSSKVQTILHSVNGHFAEGLLLKIEILQRGSLKNLFNNESLIPQKKQSLQLINQRLKDILSEVDMHLRERDDAKLRAIK